MREVYITGKEEGQRLDKFLQKYMSLAGKSFLYKMMRKKNITLNGKKASGSEKLAAGDTLRLFLADETIEKFSGAASGEALPESSGNLDIIYEDDQVLLISKRAGVLSQKARPEDVSLVEYVTAHLLENGSLTREDLKTFRPGICNRLDRNTSGLVAAGKTVGALQQLSRCFRERTVHKYYLSIVKGELRESASISGWLKKDEKKNMVQIFSEEQEGASRIETRYEPLAFNGRYTLLKILLITGKSHQIRSHLASIGHPLAGDEKYSDGQMNRYFRETYGLRHQLLHAWELKFPAMEGELSNLSDRTFFTPPPPLFGRIAQGEGFDLPGTEERGERQEKKEYGCL